MPDVQEKQSNFERTKELTDKLEAGMKDLLQSDKYKEYLNSMSHFHHYSSRNIMLINMQMPGATRVASFKLWEEQFNRHVKKGEHGIRIFAPIAEKKPETKLMEKLDPETGAPLLDEQGKVIMEEMTAMSNGPRFKLVPVFDVSQTYGEPLPELVENLTGNVAHYEAFMDALRAVSPLPIVFEPMRPEQDGYCRYGEQIGIREGMSEIQTVSAVVHEITHAKLHDLTIAADQTNKTKTVKEIEAESVSYVVNQHFGIETSPNSFGYLAEYGSRDMSELKASLDTIRKESNSLINAIDDRFHAICKERGIDLTAKAPEQAQLGQTAPQAEQPAEPQYTTETRTENIAGVDFEIQDVIPQTAERVSPEQAQAGQPIEQAAKQVPPGKSDEIVPDPAIGQSEMAIYGYSQPDMLPMLKEKALELYDKDVAVYLLYDDNTEAMAFDRSEIESFDGIFGVDRADWEKTPEYVSKDDHYEIYQIRDGDDFRDYRFASLKQMEDSNMAVDRGNYDLAYTAPLPSTETLDGLYEKFNTDRPKDYTGRSLSVSDVVVIQRGGEATAHFVDNFGFAEVPVFLADKQKEIAAPAAENEAPVPENASKPKETRFGENVAAVEARVNAGETINLSDLMGAIRADQRRPGSEPPAPTPPPVTKQDKPEPELVKPADVAVYKQPVAYAREHGELDQWRQNNNLNKDCAKAIDKAVSNSNYEPFHYDLKNAAKTVIAEYGAERVNLVLASVIQDQSYDGRYSHANKEWAKTFEVPENKVYLQSHPVLVDGFADKARQVALEKPSIMETLKANAEKSRQQSQQSEPRKESQKTKREEI